MMTLRSVGRSVGRPAHIYICKQQSVEGRRRRRSKTLNEILLFFLRNGTDWLKSWNNQKNELHELMFEAAAMGAGVSVRCGAAPRYTYKFRSRSIQPH